MAHIISTKDDFREYRVFEIVNLVAHKDYKGWMKAWYQINDDNAIWTPRMTEAKLNPDNRSVMSGCRFLNEVSADGKFITEVDNTRLKEDDFKGGFTDPNRLVFGRMKDGFHFLGVFKVDALEKEGFKNIYHRYRRVGTAVDIDTYEIVERDD